jgi:all-trans-retinol 13,14-reductase
MKNQSDDNGFDVIVIGSGMGGMTTAAALSRLGHKVLLLEQAQAIGGLTHTFSRNGFTWDVGLHYCGLFGHDQFAGRILDWLSGRTIEFHSVGTVYDVLHFPDGLDISVGRPADAYKTELKERFPDHAAEIDTYFEALHSAEEAMRIVSTERAMPEPFRSAHSWWNRNKIQRWCGRTTHEVIGDIVSDPRLAAVLSAQWGTYGGKPTEASFAMHGLIMGHYLEGARYPVGGAAAIAAGLVPVIEAAGGSARANTPVSAIVVKDGKAVGVRTSSGEEFRSPVIVSAVGADGTIRHLLPKEICQQDWAREISTFKPSMCHFEIFLGFEGDIARHGATRANHWFCESWNTNDIIWSPRILCTTRDRRTDILARRSSGPTGQMWLHLPRAEPKRAQTSGVRSSSTSKRNSWRSSRRSSRRSNNSSSTVSSAHRSLRHLSPVMRKAASTESKPHRAVFFPTLSTRGRRCRGCFSRVRMLRRQASPEPCWVECSALRR